VRVRRKRPNCVLVRWRCASGCLGGRWSRAVGGGQGRGGVCVCLVAAGCSVERVLQCTNETNRVLAGMEPESRRSLVGRVDDTARTPNFSYLIERDGLKVGRGIPQLLFLEVSVQPSRAVSGLSVAACSASRQRRDQDRGRRGSKFARLRRRFLTVWESVYVGCVYKWDV
jgi:hypothetical protein